MARQMSFLILSSVLVSLAMVSPLRNSFVLGDAVPYLRTGEVLGSNGQLHYGDTTLMMQADCNLVLYGGGFSSGTGGKGLGCSLTLNNEGQLIITEQQGKTVWTSHTGTTGTGEYVAVLRPDKQLAVYGPMIWATNGFTTSSSGSSHDEARLTNMLPAVSNMLFSGQILYDNGTLAVGYNSFTMQDDCNLVLRSPLRGIRWQSGTAGYGENCFVRLNHRGQLTILNDVYGAVWSNPVVSNTTGDFVLILHNKGYAAIYGPIVWSSAHPADNAMISGPGLLLKHRLRLDQLNEKGHYLRSM